MSKWKSGKRSPKKWGHYFIIKGTGHPKVAFYRTDLGWAHMADEDVKWWMKIPKPPKSS